MKKTPEVDVTSAEDLVDKLLTIVSSLGGNFASADPDIIDTKNFSARNCHIAKLRQLLTKLESAKSSLVAITSACVTARDAEIKSLEQLVAGPQAAQKSEEWSVVARKDRRAGSVWNKTPPAVKSPVQLQSLKPRLISAAGIVEYVPVAITAGISLQTVVVNSFDDVRQNGELHYIRGHDHFAVKIAGVLFHGNIGNIYINEKDPEKIRDCKFLPNCSKPKCTYYHDPKIYPGSKDRRNFTADSFVYSARKNGRYRTFGSLKSLDEDLALISAEESARHQSQTMHDFLCSLVLVAAGK